MEPTPLANRLGLIGVVILTATFALTMMPVLIAPLTAEADVTAVRDDSGNDAVVAVGDDDDGDDDGDDTGTNTPNTGTGDSGSRSIGSHSGNTRSGTTRGTGKSRSVSNSSGKSRVTKTGTTRGTGKSKSVSNSS
jgi:hypothetical protein